VDLESIIAFDDGNILLGGGGSDAIEGRGGNDVIDGDSWMNVRIRIVHEGMTYAAEGMTGKVYLETDSVEGRIKEGAVAQFEGKTLDALMLTAKLNPGQLSSRMTASATRTLRSTATSGRTMLLHETVTAPLG
jgi:Ca2+-binding RTX toxin-like protein